MTALGILWFALIAVLIAGYFILDGFDLGAGILSPFIAKDENEKAVVRRAIGPTWDGNEVIFRLFSGLPGSEKHQFHNPIRKHLCNPWHNWKWKINFGPFTEPFI